MKIKLLIIFAIVFHTATAQKLAIFGDAIYKTKLKTLYYRFEGEQFTVKQSIPVQMSFAYGKKFENDYRIEFDESRLRKHQFIYFSAVPAILKDSILVNQNRLNLTELFSLVDSLTEREEILSISNDLFLDDHFERLTKAKGSVNEEEAKFVATYTVSSNFTEGITEITLDDSKRYYAVSTNEVNSPFFQNEETGQWASGTFHYNSKIPALKISGIYRFNRRVGNRSRPADVGSSYDILLKEDRLLYPTGSPAYKELKRK